MAVEILGSLSPGRSRHIVLGLRPPVGAYNSSLLEVIRAFETLLNTLDSFRNEQCWHKDKENWQDPLVADCERMLYRMFEHATDCRNILDCLLPSGGELKTNRTVKDFDKRIKLYRDHVGAVVNRLKHRQRRIRAIVFYDIDPIIPGYYLETVGTIQDNGVTVEVVQPDSEIHANADTAFSFHRDLRYHFCNLYLISQHLANAVHELTSTVPAVVCTRNQNFDDRLFNIAQRIAALPEVFYPDELKKTVPAVAVREDNDLRTIRTEFPSVHMRPATVSTARITVGLTWDGVTRRFKVPYALISSWRV